MFNRGGAGADKPRGFGFSGFAIQPRRTGPETQMAEMSVTGMAGRNYGQGYGKLGKRRMKSEEEYFYDDDGEAPDDQELEYQPAPGSPGAVTKDGVDSDGSDDPLDAFMQNIEKEVKKQSKVVIVEKEEPEKGVRDDIDTEDHMESYFRYMEENPTAGLLLDDDDEIIEYDEDGNAILPDKKIIDPLPDIDHTAITYAPFIKNFYEEHEEIRKLSYKEVEDLRKKLGIRVSGIMPLRPISSFAHFGFDEQLLKAIRKANYTQPTPIQAQGVPIALSGRDIIGIAKTGSGKTAAFLWPLLVHIMDQRELKPGDGPVGLICAPTRELSQQIYHEARKFGKAYNINVVCAYGGGNLYEQCKACEDGAEIIVATPGRLIDLVRKKATNLTRVTYLVFDEADRMFDMGFEPQVRSIADHVRPDRQTLLFSATFKRKVERLARDILTDPFRVIQGDIGEANEDVTQIVKVMASPPSKWTWLLSQLVKFTIGGSVLIFVTRKANSEEFASNLKLKDFKVGLMHGDMSQTERNEVINAFKKKEMSILIATDVAARGLDIPHIKTVVNYDVARDIDTHTHRIGRTGRAGEKGTAYTLVTLKDKDFAGHLVRNLEGANQYVPEELLDLAMQNPWFKKNRFRQQKAKKMNISTGLGLRERPGLGSAGSGGGSSTQGEEEAPPGTWQPSKPTTPGPQSDRISTMRSAFQAQFKTNFVTASPSTAWSKKDEKVDQALLPPPEQLRLPQFQSGAYQNAAASIAAGSYGAPGSNYTHMPPPVPTNYSNMPPPAGAVAGATPRFVMPPLVSPGGVPPPPSGVPVLPMGIPPPPASDSTESQSTRRKGKRSRWDDS